MTLSLSRRQTFRESLPSFFESKKPRWLNPKDSVGPKCISINGLHCWQVVGPALKAMEDLSVPIKELLDKHQDLLEQGESKPRAVSFNMWMIGHIPDSAEPTIVFSSKSKRQRTYAKALLQESRLLDDHPGVKIKTLDKMPAVYQSAEQLPSLASDNISENSVYMLDNSRGLCGALIAFGKTRIATMGGVLLINGFYYGISAQHARLDPPPIPDDLVTDSVGVCFDDDSDSESDDPYEITSKGSVSSNSDYEADSESFGSSSTDRVFDAPYSSRMAMQDRSFPQQAAHSVNLRHTQYRRISNLSPSYVENDLDYEVFQLDDPMLYDFNNIDPPAAQGAPPVCISPNRVVRSIVECNVWAATGTTGCVNGTILKTPYFIKMERSRTFQEMWAVRLDRKTVQGDCGAWVIDALTGDIYGHIVAGDPITGLAFIIPAYKVFDDIEQRFGALPLFPKKRCVWVSNLCRTSGNSQRQVAPLVQLGATLRLVMAWLLWSSQHLLIPCQDRQRLILSLLSSGAFGKCLKNLHILTDIRDYLSLLFERSNPLRRYQGTFSTNFVYYLKSLGSDRRQLDPERFEKGRIYQIFHLQADNIFIIIWFDWRLFDYYPPPSGPNSAHFRALKLADGFRPYRKAEHRGYKRLDLEGADSPPQSSTSMPLTPDRHQPRRCRFNTGFNTYEDLQSRVVLFGSSSDGEAGDIPVLILGATGSGKSTSINACVSRAAERNYLPRSCEGTAEVDHAGFETKGRPICLINSPGLDVTSRSDADILKDLVLWLRASYERENPFTGITGVVYLHRITDSWTQSSAVKRLRRLEVLCGEVSLPRGHITVPTTTWVPQFEGTVENLSQPQQCPWRALERRSGGLIRHPLLNTEHPRAASEKPELQRGSTPRGCSISSTILFFFVHYSEWPENFAGSTSLADMYLHYI